jgi:hypothetical protein
MTRPKFKLTLLAVLALAGCSQILGIDDYDIDEKLDGAPVGGDGNEGGTDGGSNSQAGTRNNEAGEPGSMGGDGGTAQGGTAGSSNLGGAGDSGMGGDGGGPPVGELFPCDSEDCCDEADGTAVGTELLLDGGFEAGPVADGESPWRQDSTGKIQAITDDLTLGWEPKAGVYYAYLSGLAGEQTTVYSEDLVIPRDAGWLVVSGFRNFQIDEEVELNEDFAGIGFYSYTAGEDPYVPFFWSRPSDNGDGWGATNTAWQRFEASWDAAPHQGKTRYLGMRGRSDLYPTEDDASSYLFDEVSLKAYRCYK